MFFMGGGKKKIQILYDAKTDLLYLRLDDKKQDVINKRISEGIVLDIGEGDRIAGKEILDSSKYLSLEKLLPVSLTSFQEQFKRKHNISMISEEFIYGG